MMSSVGGGRQLCGWVPPWPACLLTGSLSHWHDPQSRPRLPAGLYSSTDECSVSPHGQSVGSWVRDHQQTKVIWPWGNHLIQYIVDPLSWEKNSHPPPSSGHEVAPSEVPGPSDRCTAQWQPTLGTTTAKPVVLPSTAPSTKEWRSTARLRTTPSTKTSC